MLMTIDTRRSEARTALLSLLHEWDFSTTEPTPGLIAPPFNVEEVIDDNYEPSGPRTYRTMPTVLRSLLKVWLEERIYTQIRYIGSGERGRRVCCYWLNDSGEFLPVDPMFYRLAGIRNDIRPRTDTNDPHEFEARLAGSGFGAHDHMTEALLHTFSLERFFPLHTDYPQFKELPR